MNILTIKRVLLVKEKALSKILQILNGKLHFLSSVLKVWTKYSKISMKERK